MTIYRASQLLDESFRNELGLVVHLDEANPFYRSIQLRRPDRSVNCHIWINNVTDNKFSEFNFTVRGMDDDYPYNYRCSDRYEDSDGVVDNMVHLLKGLRDYSQMSPTEFLAELGERLAGNLISGAETERMVNWYFDNLMQGKSDIQKNNFLKRWTSTKQFYISAFDKKWYYKSFITNAVIMWQGERVTKKVTPWQVDELHYDARNDCYLLPSDPSIIRYNGRWYQTADLQQNYTTCSQCNWFVHNNDHIDGVCISCIGLPEERMQLMGYSSRATQFFEFKIGKKANKKRPIFMGVELELEGATTRTIRSSAILLKDHAILKRDGSLSDGLEICSAPATLDVHEEEFKKFFDKFPQGLEAKASCGMHVHIDRKHLSKLQIGKILDLVYNKENRRFIETVAGRKGNTYCSLDEERSFTFHMYRSEKSTSRYSGINLINDKTIELRIFNATTKFQEFMKNVEFCQALVDYTNPCGLNVAQLKDQSKLETFLMFIKNNWKDYQHLASFLAEKGYIEDRRTKPRSGRVTMDVNVLKQAAKKAVAQVEAI